MFETILMVMAIYLSPAVALLAFAYGMDRWASRSIRRDVSMSDPLDRVSL